MIQTLCAAHPPSFCSNEKTKASKASACPEISGWLVVEPGWVSTPSSVLFFLLQTALTALSVTGAL